VWAAQHERVVLELEPGDPIQGRLVDSSGMTHAFYGWLELCAELERARRSATADG
jgi:hypothetical protein